MTNYILPLKAPNPLPASGVTTVTFKVWRNTLIAHISQDAHHHHFMPGGLYSEWTAAEDGDRIGDIHEEDPDKLTLDEKRERIGDNEYDRSVAKLLTTRNSQLAKFVTHVATLCHITENDDVTNLSTSLDWIFVYLKKHYGLESKGANSMNISDHVFKSDVPYQTFYKQYRASFIDNLRKRGDVVKFKNDQVLPEDEKLSPTFENAIILWTLEKIDPRLPAKVRKDYGHQMTGDVTLKDVQPVIFEHIDSMLEDLDQNQAAKAFASQTIDEEPLLNAASFRNSTRGRRYFTRSRGFNRTNAQKKYSGSNKVSSSTSQVSSKYCRICDLAGSDPRIYTSHEIGRCNRLSIRDLESIKNALLLNGMITLTSPEPEIPSYELQPGWDYCEAADDTDQLSDQA